MFGLPSFLCQCHDVKSEMLTQDQSALERREEALIATLSERDWSLGRKSLKSGPHLHHITTVNQRMLDVVVLVWRASSSSLIMIDHTGKGHPFC